MKDLKRVLYIAPRFHTNQVYNIKSLLRKGIEVEFISYYSHKVENYEDIKPRIIGYSLLFKIILYFLYRNNDDKKSKFEREFGFPSFIKIFKLMKKFKPDLIILRESNIYSLFCIQIARILKIKTVIYTQFPKNHPIRNTKIFKKKLKIFLFGKYEMTPIQGNKNINEIFNGENIFYVPLTIDVNKRAKKPKHNKREDPVNIIMVSEFTPRKKILETIEVIKALLIKKYDIRLTIIGNADKNNTKKYLNEVLSYIENNKLDKFVSIKTDIPHDEVLQYYLQNDIFVFSSVREPAGYSLLEALSSGLSVISSTGNGLSEYIIHNESGLIFKEEDYSELEICLKYLLDSPEKREQICMSGLNLISNQFNSEKYYENIKLMWEKINKK